MPKPLTDRDVLARTLQLLENSGECCGAFESMGTWVRSMCPGPDHRPVPMASCRQATAAWELRQYMRSHGGWCPEHGQNLSECHPPEERPDPKAEVWWRQCKPHHICRCQPVTHQQRRRAA
jgi:hypothetical protein